MTKKIDIFKKKKVWTKAPRAFIFLVCQMIFDRSGRFCHEDLLDFLGAKTEEIKYFMKNPEIIPIEWLLSIGETPEGNDLLAKFNSLPKRTIGEQEYCLILDESNYLSEDDAIKRLLTEGDLYDFPQDDLLTVFLDEAKEASPDLHVILPTKRDGEAVSAPVVPLDKKDPKPVHSGDNKSKGEEKIVDTGVKKVVIGKKKRTCTRRKTIVVINHSEQFLAGLYRIVGLRDMSGLNRVFGAETVAQFKKDKIVPLKWVEILAGYDGGKAHLERFGGILKIASRNGKESSQKNTADVVLAVNSRADNKSVIEPVLDVAKDKHAKNSDHKLIPIGDVFLVLKCVKEVSKKEDADIAKVLRLNAQSITYMRKGKKRMHSGHLNIMIKKFKIEPKLLERWM
ncbi:MAG TPA: hypothetical protein DDY52_03540 [Candidatus Moranbacteria bacterium]|nr:hypothetical protein [Candidatus Moranbacteria bacterium]